MRAQELEHERFARELARRLDRGVDGHAFDRLIIAAPPDLPRPAAQGVAASASCQRLVLDLDADYSNVPARELPDRVPVL